MSYAEAKRIVLCRQELRECVARRDHAAAAAALAQLKQVAGNDNELVAEIQRWAIKLQVA